MDKDPNPNNIRKENKLCETNTSFSKDASRHSILFPKHDANSPIRDTL